MAKVLFLPAYFKPEVIAFSQIEDNIIDALIDNDFELLVYTPFPTRGIDENTRKLYKRHKNEVLFGGKMIIKRFSIFRENKNSFLRAVRYLICCFKQFCFSIFLKDIDVIFIGSTPPIQGFMGALVKKFTKVPLVYNLQDVFPDSLVGAGLAKKESFLWKIGRIIEDYTYRNADKIIVISDDFKQNILKKGVPEKKIEVIYNWVDEDEIIPIDKASNPLYDEFKISRDNFNIVYAGNLGNAQNVDILIDAALHFKNNPKINFVIFGSGSLRQNYLNRINNLDLENIKIFPLQKQDLISYVYSLGDVSLVSCKKGLGGSAMPSKTWSILSTGTPLLVSFDENTELQHIVERHNLGLFSDAQDFEGFIKSIEYFYNNPKEHAQMGMNARRYITEKMSKNISTSKYIKVINSVIKNK